jgi:hypothetical protein
LKSAKATPLAPASESSRLGISSRKGQKREVTSLSPPSIALPVGDGARRAGCVVRSEAIAVPVLGELHHLGHVAVVGDAIADLGRARVGRGVRVVAVRLRERVAVLAVGVGEPEAITVAVLACARTRAHAVVDDAIADLGCVREHEGVGVVAVVFGEHQREARLASRRHIAVRIGGRHQVAVSVLLGTRWTHPVHPRVAVADEPVAVLGGGTATHRAPGVIAVVAGLARAEHGDLTIAVGVARPDRGSLSSQSSTKGGKA